MVSFLQVETFYALPDSSSFYGANKETICSLMLSILPRPGHKYDKLSKSLVSTASEVNSVGSVFSTNESSSNKVILLQNVIKCLHKFGGFCYMEVNVPVLHSTLLACTYILTLIAG